MVQNAFAPESGYLAYLPFPFILLSPQENPFPCARVDIKPIKSYK
jgi:hypothetical protein